MSHKAKSRLLLNMSSWPSEPGSLSFARTGGRFKEWAGNCLLLSQQPFVEHLRSAKYFICMCMSMKSVPMLLVMKLRPKEVGQLVQQLSS